MTPGTVWHHRQNNLPIFDEAVIPATKGFPFERIIKLCPIYEPHNVPEWLSSTKA